MYAVVSAIVRNAPIISTAKEVHLAHGVPHLVRKRPQLRYSVRIYNKHRNSYKSPVMILARLMACLVPKRKQHSVHIKPTTIYQLRERSIMQRAERLEYVNGLHPVPSSDKDYLVYASNVSGEDECQRSSFRTYRAESAMRRHSLYLID